MRCCDWISRFVKKFFRTKRGTPKISLMLAVFLLAFSWEATLAPAKDQTVPSKRMSLELVVGPQVYQKAGLHKLTPEEQWALLDWLDNYVNFLTKSVEEDCKSKKK